MVMCVAWLGSLVGDCSYCDLVQLWILAQKRVSRRYVLPCTKYLRGMKHVLLGAALSVSEVEDHRN